MKSVVLLQCQSHGKSSIMLEDDCTVGRTRHCLVKEGLFSVKQRQDVVQVSSSEFDESLLNDCDEAAIDYVADQHGHQEL